MKRGIFCRVGMRHKGEKDAILTREQDDQGVHTWPSQEDFSCGLLPDGHAWLKNSSAHTYHPVSIYTTSDGLNSPFASSLQITQYSWWKETSWALFVPILRGAFLGGCRLRMCSECSPASNEEPWLTHLGPLPQSISSELKPEPIGPAGWVLTLWG